MSLVIGGERQPSVPIDSADAHRAELAYGFVSQSVAADAIEVARAPLVERPLRLPRAVRSILPNPIPELALVAPFGRREPKGFREIANADPRIARLWGRFSVDVGVAVERSTSLFADRVVRGGRHRIFIVEDGDRYAIRAMCAFTVREDDDGTKAGHVAELLHDRSVAGLRGAIQVLGLALRAMSDEGAEVARAWSFAHSGTFPIFLRHAFVPRPSPLALRVRSTDPALESFVRERRHWYVSLLDA